MNNQTSGHNHEQHTPAGMQVEAAARRDATVEYAMRFVLSVIPEPAPSVPEVTPVIPEPQPRVDGRTAVSTGSLIMNHYPNQRQLVEDARRQIDGAV